MKISMETIIMETQTEGKTVAEYEEKFRSVEYEGDTYVLLEQAYIHYSGSKARYLAEAVKLGEEIAEDGNGNPCTVTTYLLSWVPVEGWEENEDESDNCDWKNPSECGEVSWVYVG